MSKDRLRQAMLVRRGQLNADLYRSLSLRVQQNLIDMPCFQQAQTLALYSPVHNEVHTGRLLDKALEEGKQIFFPRVHGERLEFFRVSSATDLFPGAFGVKEPVGHEGVLKGHLDVIVVPGVVFDQAGYRLGYGKGFYDRELAQLSTLTCSVGLCFEFQLCNELPREAHDRAVGRVVTERQIITCHENVAVQP